MATSRRSTVREVNLDIMERNIQRAKFLIVDESEIDYV